jgi:hypothetical protein
MKSIKIISSLTRAALAFTLVAQVAAADMIDRVIRRESDMRTISDAMAVKESGLRYVLNLSDFERLSSYAFSSPSEGYRAAVGDFIAKNVATFVKSADEIPTLLAIEQRAITISNAQIIKQAGLPVVRRLRDFKTLADSAFSNPSEGYVAMLSTFIATHIGIAIHPRTPIQAILEMEGRCKLISEAMAVKTAGLAAVQTPEEFWELTESAFSNPSDGYRDAVGAFIRQYQPTHGN